MTEKEFPIASNRPTHYTGTGQHRHFFADHQHCLKCGKSERAGEANDCDMSIEDYEIFVKRAYQSSTP